MPPVRNHELTAGLVYSRRDEGWSNRDIIGDPAPVGDIRAWDGSYAEPALGERYVTSDDTLTQEAVYSAARLQVTDRFKLIAGGRISNFKRESKGGVWSTAFETEDKGIFTPYAGLLYDLGQYVTAYASYTEIFLPQSNQEQDGDYLDPAEGVSYEAGLKAEFSDGTLNASAAVFFVDQNNYAVQDGGFVLGSSDPSYISAQGVETKGYELELVGSLTPNWNVSLGWTHYSAKDADDEDVAVDHPRKLLKVFTKYKLQGALAGLSLGGGVEWESATPARAENPATGELERVGQGSYALVDLMAEYAFSKKLSVQLNINNVFDEKYHSTSYWWGAPFTYGDPRNVVASLDYSF